MCIRDRPYRELMKELVSAASIKINQRILDLGTGTGNLRYFLPSDVHIIGIDNSSEALAYAKNKFPYSENIKQSILETLPFRDNSFDRIITNNVLYTLNKGDWNKVVSELHRILKPNGIIVVSNLHIDFKAISIYLDHIKKSISKKGFLFTFFQLSLIHISEPTRPY